MTHFSKTLLLFFFIINIVSSVLGQTNTNKDCSLNIQNLSCNRLTQPLGIVSVAPKLSWILSIDHSCYQQRQTAYQILVASTKELLEEQKADIWDSKKVNSSSSQLISFKGNTLKAFKTYYWKVKVWDENGKASQWSTIAEWTMGKLSAKQNGNWISTGKTLKEATKEEKGKAYYFFKNINLPPTKIKSAKILVSGLGLFELYLNKQKVGNHVLDPSDTDYRNHATYVLFDALPYLQNENNSIGVLLGNGKHLLNSRQYRDYGLPRLYLELHITYENNQQAIFYADQTWQWTSHTPIQYNNEFNGETYDARISMPYTLSEKALSKLAAPVALLAAYRPQLSPQLQEPRRIIEERKALTISEPEPNVYVFDFGQNLTGWGKLQITGKKGDTISMRTAELLLDNGKIDTASVRAALSTDRYILGTDTKETYHPRFTYHGFRYIQVKGLKKRPDLNSIKVCVVHSDLKPTGNFNTPNNPTLNLIYKVIQWTLRSNYQSLPLDCPQRDERFGWLGDRAATINGESFMYDVHAIYRKWLLDIKNSQSPEGAISNVVPEHWPMPKYNMTWPVAYPYIADRLYQQYGDEEIIALHYHPIKKWLTFIEKYYADNGIIFCDQYGDWSIPPNTVNDFENTDPRLKSSADILATTAYLHTLRIMKNWAASLGKKEEQLEYEKKYKKSKKRLYDDYMDHSLENYGNNTPTELILLLSIPDLDSLQKDTLLNNLEGKLKGQYNERLVFGLIGMRFLWRTLSNNGRLDLAYDLAKQTDYPGLGYMAMNGATTLWEHWNGDHRGSHNHIMLSGDLLEWYYSYLGGIQFSQQNLYKKDYQPYQHFILHPHIPEKLDAVAVVYHSSQGKIMSSWTQHKETENHSTFNWSIQVPVGAVAEVRIPCAVDKLTQIQLNQEFLKNVKISGFRKGACVKVHHKNYQIIYLGSGSYHIQSYLKNSKNQAITEAPLIYPADTLAKKGESVLVVIKAKQENKGTKIYYTLDGTDPTPKSKCYKKPFKVKKYTVVKAISVEEQKSASCIKNSIIDFYDPDQNGWKYQYYEKSLVQLPDFDTLKVVNEGYIAQTNVYKVRKKAHGWATRFHSNVKIPKTGMYTFYLACDDGAAFYINDTLVLKNDGIHYKTQRAKKIYLKKGVYKIRLEHFNNYSIAGLELGISGKGLPRQKIPVSFLYYKD